MFAAMGPAALFFSPMGCTAGLATLALAAGAWSPPHCRQAQRVMKFIVAHDEHVHSGRLGPVAVPATLPAQDVGIKADRSC